MVSRQKKIAYDNIDDPEVFFEAMSNKDNPLIYHIS